MMRGVQAASLDHAVWFHRPFRVDEWLLYAMDAPATAGARGFTRGSLFTRDGALVASTVQEGLLRVRQDGERRVTGDRVQGTAGNDSAPAS
jgi:acyl-CoA thioesterase-2